VQQRTGWQQDGIHFLLGLTLASVCLGAVAVVGGLLLLLLSLVAPASLQTAMQAISQPLQIGVLVLALLEVIAWNLLPMIGFVSQQLARRIAVAMAAIMLFMAVSLLFSL
jgi:hypothetical protein